MYPAMACCWSESPAKDWIASRIVLPANWTQRVVGTAVFFAQRFANGESRSTRLAGSSSTVAMSKAGSRWRWVRPAVARPAR